METNEVIEKLLQKAADAITAHEALHWTQAALNAAHVCQVVAQTKQIKS